MPTNNIAEGQSTLDSNFFTSVVSSRVRISANFGSTVNLGDNVNDAKDQIIVQFTFNVNDAVANTGLTPSRVVSLDARVIYSTSKTVSSTQSITFLEPQLINSISDDAVYQQVDGRDTVTYTYTVSMTGISTAPAYRVCLSIIH